MRVIIYGCSCYQIKLLLVFHRYSLPYISKENRKKKMINLQSKLIPLSKTEGTWCLYTLFCFVLSFLNHLPAKYFNNACNIIYFFEKIVNCSFNDSCRPTVFNFCEFCTKILQFNDVYIVSLFYISLNFMTMKVLT